MPSAPPTSWGQRERPSTLLRGALRVARRLPQGPGLPMVFLATGYDTAFEPLAHQVHRKLAQLRLTFGDRAWILHLIDDLPPHAGLQAEARRSAAALGMDARLIVEPFAGPRPGPSRSKAAALQQGMLRWRPDQVRSLTYLNLNLKVHAGFAAPGIEAIELGYADWCLGTRDPREGGHVQGAGPFGRLKTRAFNRWTTSVLPQLRPYRDTNAPVKSFGPAALEILQRGSSYDGLVMDVEWMLLLHRAGMRAFRHPIVWTQRPGSRPPWSRMPKLAWDVHRLRSRFPADPIGPRRRQPNPNSARMEDT